MEFRWFVKDLLFFSPVGLLLLGALWRDKYTPDRPFFATQPWRYGDVLLVFALTTALGLSNSISPLSRLPALTVYVVTTSSQATCIVGAVYLLLRWKYRCSFSTIGFRGPHSLYYIAWSLAICSMVVVLAGIYLCYFMLTFRSLQDLMVIPGGPKAGSSLDNLARQSVDMQIVTIGFYLNVAAIMPFAEEILSRGFVFTPLVRKFGGRWAAIISAGLFSLMHGPTVRALSAVVFGLIYVHLYRRTESLIPSLTLHIAGNSLMLLVTLASDLQHAEGLLLPGIGLFLVLSFIFWYLMRRLRPSDPDERLAWS